MGVLEATLQACHLRFRPIIMTSVAFILGVLPWWCPPALVLPASEPLARA